MVSASTLVPTPSNTVSPSQQGDEGPVPSGLAPPTRRRPVHGLSALCRVAVRRQFGKLERGSLAVTDACGTQSFGNASPGELSAAFEVQDDRFYRLAALGGSLGFAEAYLRGYWRTDDLVGLFRLLSRNLQSLANVDHGWPLLTWPVRKAAQLLRRNTIHGSRRNIMAHYDLGNDFFRLFLDPTMTYSSGIFESPESTLEEASRAKYDRICRKLALGHRDHVVEIGTGWGGFAIHAAGRYGCRVTTTTISPSQYEYARQRIADAGLSDRVELLLRDYRELTGRYDKLVSIEMIEAVGHEYLPRYFGKCSDLLKPDGMMALQAITIPDQRYDTYRKSVDFIQQYVFPGGCLPSLGAICDAIRRTTDLTLTHLEDFGADYARTLAQWRARFFENLDAVRQLGLDDRFIRCWDYYLCYCEGGFTERQTGVAQILLQKPDCRNHARSVRL